MINFELKTFWLLTMNYKYLWLSINLLLVFNLSFSQKNIISLKKQAHGTLVFTVICKDGILIASDSRASFTIGKGKSQKVYAYLDNNQKIFTIGNFKIGVTGLSMLNKQFISEIIEKFNKTFNPDSTLENTFNTFLSFLKIKMNVPDSSIFGENQYILAGYENSKPITLGISSGRTIREMRIGGLIHSDKNFEGYLKKPSNMELTCINIAPLLESAIYRFADDKNDNMIGGPIHIIQIGPDNTFFEIKSFNTITFKTYKEYAEAILNNKLKVEYLYPDSKELLIKTLIEGIKLGY
jgi:hypothetical protein